MNKFLHFLPRGLASLITLFLTPFILEGFDPEFGWQSGVGHALLALVALGATVLAWKRPRIGGWVFLAAGIMYIFEAVNGGRWGGLFLGSIPCLTGTLFLLEGYRKKR